jgi:hypothetical protein
MFCPYRPQMLLVIDELYLFLTDSPALVVARPSIGRSEVDFFLENNRYNAMILRR